MQTSVVKSSYRESTEKKSGRRNGLGSYEQGSFCIELWKKAFKNACERLCPVRAEGHECGCLSALLLLVCVYTFVCVSRILYTFVTF